MDVVFQQLNQAYLNNPYPHYRLRLHRLKQLKRLLEDNAQCLAEAISKDFGNRSQDETYLLELLPLLESIRYCAKHLKAWMKPAKRRLSWQFAFAHAEVFHQPLGVVGVVVPWNYPLMLSLGPLINSMAAGNMTMIKLSEKTAHVGALLQQLLIDYELDCVKVVQGGVDTAKNFCQLSFAHLLYTGNAEGARSVMRACSERLTPMTLELGGRSPVIIGESVKPHSLDRLWMGKFFNSGQTCVAPDHVFVPQSKLPLLIRSGKAAFRAHYPAATIDNDLTCIMSKAEWQRLNTLKEDAINLGAECIELCEHPLKENGFGPCLLINVPASAAVLNEEIFGPLLPLIVYDDFDALVDRLKRLPRPLALYYFGEDRREQRELKHQTVTGSLVFNDTLIQAAMNSLPFGGVGGSGMGQYHGKEGFTTFSKARPIVTQARFALWTWMFPPFTAWGRFLMAKLMKLPSTKKRRAHVKG